MVIHSARLKAQCAVVKKRWRLTERQLEVLELLAKGCSNAEIAAVLEISERTVEVHVGDIFMHVRCRSRTELIAMFWSAC